MLKKAVLANNRGIIRTAERKINSNYGMIATKAMTKRASTEAVTRMAPAPFSPFYKESNLNLPREKPEMNAVLRHYYNSDAWVGNAIDLHSTYPLSSFGVKCKSTEIKNFFNEMLDDLNFNSFIYDVAREYWIIGEAFIMLELDENQGKWSDAIIHNPDFIMLKKHLLTSPLISLKPDNDLQRIITSTDPDDAEIRKQLDPEILPYIMSGKNIPLDPALISHIARKTAPYDVRGTSILTRVLPDLYLRDQYNEANYVIAQNHITPLRVVKVGNSDGSYRPNAEDLIQMREMLEQAVYDPNFTLITHTGVEISYIGASGQILQLGSEMDRLEERVLTGLFTSKAFTTSEGPCFNMDTEVLTENGWKLYDDVQEGEKIACFDTSSFELKYHKPLQRHKWKFEGELCNFETQRISVSVTPDHRMFVKRNNSWQKIDAKDVKLNDKFLCHIEWNDGETPDIFEVCGRKIPSKIWMKFLGYWISEGCILVNPKRKNRNENGGTWQVRVSQHSEKNPETYADIKSVFDQMGFKYSICVNKHGGCSDFIICSKEFVEFMLLEMGGDIKSKDKHIPRKYLNLNKSLLLEIYQALMNGDGNKRMQGKKKDKAYFTYTTISTRLADDFMEIVYKCGFCPVKRWDKHGGKNGIWRIIWGENKDKLLYPGLTRKQHFIKQPYNDYVWCFEVPTSAFITRRNGKIGQHFNTYSNASVALEVLQQRYVSFRTMIERWLERKVFAPISRLHDFYEYNNGIPQLIVPKVDWQKINLKNNREYQSALEGLARDNKVSLHALHSSLDLDYDEEINKIKDELEDQKEIAYKLQSAYQGKENINVATAPGDEEKAPDGGSMPEQGGESGGEGGLDLGGDIGGGGGMDLGGGMEEGGGEIGGEPEMGGPTESAPPA